MATCAIRPSLLNKFTFRPVYIPPPGDSHRIICHDATRNIMFSPEYNNGGAVINSPNLGRTFVKNAAPSLINGNHHCWCLGSEGFLLGRKSQSVADVLAWTEAGGAFTTAPGGGVASDYEISRLFFGNNNYFSDVLALIYGNRVLVRKEPGGSVWTGSAQTGFGGNNMGPKIYLKGNIYCFDNAAFRSGTGLVNTTTVVPTDFPSGRITSVNRQWLSLVGRNLDIMSVLSTQGTLFRSENAGENWIEGAPVGVPEYNGRWVRPIPGLGRFGEEVILVIADNGEMGALSVDRGETWRLFDLPEFLRYVGDWQNVEIAYVEGAWLGAFGNYGIWELTPDYRG